MELFIISRLYLKLNQYEVLVIFTNNVACNDTEWNNINNSS